MDGHDSWMTVKKCIKKSNTTRARRKNERNIAL